jgi:energy-converting hydrogenase Eha subunit E
MFFYIELLQIRSATGAFFLIIGKIDGDIGDQFRRYGVAAMFVTATAMAGISIISFSFC